MSDKLTDVELISTVALHEQVGSEAAAKYLGLADRAYRQRLTEAKARGLNAKSEIVSEADRLKRKLIEAAVEIKRLQQEALTHEIVSEQIYGVASHRPEPPEWIFGKGTNGDRGAPMTLWSDWHRGEIVRPEEVGGVNEFSSIVHDDRVRKLVSTTIDLCANHMGRASRRYPGVVICLGGDFVNGSLHPEDDDFDATPLQCVNELSDVMAGAIDRMATKFGHVYAPAVVGNHGRLSHKPRTRGIIHENLEWLVYKNLQRFFAKTKNVVIDISPETDVWFKCFGHRFLLTHGDRLGVKGGDGIIGAIGPIMRGSMKVGRSEAQIGRDYDTILMGHWHQYLTLPGIIVNGALKGYDNFARNVLRASYQRPLQALWFVHPQHGITAQWPVYLEPLRQATDNTEWVSFRRAT